MIIEYSRRAECRDCRFCQRDRVETKPGAKYKYKTEYRCERDGKRVRMKDIACKNWEL